MNFALNLNAKNEAQFAQIINEATADLTNLGLLFTKKDQTEEEGQQNIVGKIAKICYSESFSLWLVNNGTLLKNTKWRKYLLRKGFINQAQIDQIKPSENDLKWSEKNCENEFGIQKVMKLFTDTQCEVHFSVIQKLINKFPGVTKPFADKAWTLPRYRNYAIFNAEEQIELYKLIFDSDEKTSHETETKLAMKQLIGMAKESEESLFKNPEIADEIRKAKVQTFTVMALSESFCPSKEWPMDRMLCPLGQYVQFLSEMFKNRPKIEWEAQNWCFSHDVNEIFAWARQILLGERVEFFKNYLKRETNGKDDEMIRIIREKPGAILRLHNFVQHKLIEELWKDEQIREKLYNANFFSNKSLLLHNYRRAMAKSSSPIERLGGRLAADIAAMANHLSAKFPKVQPHLRAALSSCQSFSPPFSPNSNFSSFSELLDFVWVDLRFLYDKSDTTICDERTYKLTGIFVSDYLSELYKFIEKQFKKPSKNAQEIWINRTHFFVATISNLRWLEEMDEKAVEPLELVQQIHFEALKKHLNDEEIGREMREIFLDCPQFLQIGTIFLPISKENGNKKCGKKHEKKFIENLLQFLKMGDIKKLFEMNGITFNESEFITAKESEEKGKNIQRNETKKGKGKKKRKNQKMNKKEAKEKKEKQTEKEEKEKDKEKKAEENLMEEEEKNTEKLEEKSPAENEKELEKIKVKRGENGNKSPAQFVLLEGNPTEFVEKHKDFIVINCVAEQKNTEINREETFKIVGELVNREFSINFGKVWLFGIEMPANGNEILKEHLMSIDIEMKMEYLQQLGLLSVEMDEMEIINEFQKLGANVLSTVAKKWFLMDILEDKNNNQ
ncbi:hypothetical protein niasHT_025034 [Heterodera trifolii]